MSSSKTSKPTESIVSSSSSRKPHGTAPSSSKRASSPSASSTADKRSSRKDGDKRDDDRDRRRDRSRSRESHRGKTQDSSRSGKDRDESRPLHRSSTEPIISSSRQHRSSSDVAAREDDDKDNERRRSSTTKTKKSSRVSTRAVDEDAITIVEVAPRESPSSRSFSQFPGQYDTTPSGMPSSSSLPPMSSHVQDQFPGQFPEGSTAPYRPPLSVVEGGPGLAAEYYGDQGQSVQNQPGIRPDEPTVIMGTEPHLQTPSSVSAPPIEPSALGGVGAAASFFNDPDLASFTSPKPSRPSKTQKSFSSSSGRPSKISESAIAAGGVATALAYGAVMASGSSHGVASHQATGSAPFIPTNGATSYGPNADQQAPYGSIGLYMADSATPAAYQTPHNESEHYSIAGSPNPSRFIFEQRRRGPMGRIVDFWRDPDGVADFEEYTEYIGVCRHCFAPNSSPRDAPRVHHYRKGSGRVEKERRRRYSSDSSSGKRSNGKSWLATGLAGYGLASVGKTLFKKDSFGDLYSSRTGRASTTSVHGSIGGRSVTSRGETRRRSRSHSRHRTGIQHSHDKNRSRSQDRVQVGITSDGRLYKQDLKSGTTLYSEGTHRARSRSRSRDALRVTATTGSTIKSSASTRMRRRSKSKSPTRASVRGKAHRSRERSPASKVRSPDRKSKRRRSPPVGLLAGIFGVSSVKGHREGKKRSKSSGGLVLPGTHSKADLDLVSVVASDERRAKYKAKGSSSSRRSDAAMLATSLAALTVVADQVMSDGKGKRRAQVVAVKEPKEGHRHHQPASSKRRAASAHSSASSSDMGDEGWESDVEEDALSIGHPDLAFGSFYDESTLMSRGSRESVVSDASSGTGKWGWRWGRKSSEKKRARDPTTRPAYPDETSTGSTAPMTGVANTGAALYDQSGDFHETDRYSSVSSNFPPLQQVIPIPTSDPTNFDVGRPDLFNYPSEPLLTSPPRPTPVLIQQPQPYAPVNTAIYTTQAPIDPTYSAPAMMYTSSYSKDPVVRDSVNTLVESPRTFPAVDPFAYQLGDDAWSAVGASKDRDGPLRRRDTSPSAEPSKAMSKKEGKRRSTLQDGETSSVPRTTEQLPRKADRQTKQVSESSKRVDDSSRKGKKRQEDEERAALEQMRKNRRSRRAESSPPRSTDPSERSGRESDEVRSGRVTTTAVGAVVGAAVGAFAAAPRSSKSDDRRSQRTKDAGDAAKAAIYDIQRDDQDVTRSGREVDRKADIARMAASKVVAASTAPVAEYSILDKYSGEQKSQAEFFMPDVLRKSREEQARSTIPVVDHDGVVFDMSDIVEVAPADGLFGMPYPGLPPTAGRPGYGAGGSLSLPWSVPRLNLITPTPVPSVGGRSAPPSPLVAAERSADDVKEISKEVDLSKTPETVASSTNKLPKSGEDAMRSNVADKVETQTHVPGQFDDDIDFAATVAAGLEDTGFDPSIVLDDPAFRRRDSPPGSEGEADGYRKPYADSVTDQSTHGIDRSERKSTTSSRRRDAEDPSNVEVPFSTTKYDMKKQKKQEKKEKKDKKKRVDIQVRDDSDEFEVERERYEMAPETAESANSRAPVPELEDKAVSDTTAETSRPKARGPWSALADVAAMVSAAAPKVIEAPVPQHPAINGRDRQGPSQRSAKSVGDVEVSPSVQQTMTTGRTSPAESESLATKHVDSQDDSATETANDKRREANVITVGEVEALTYDRDDKTDRSSPKAKKSKSKSKSTRKLEDFAERDGPSVSKPISEDADLGSGTYINEAKSTPRPRTLSRAATEEDLTSASIVPTEVLQADDWTTPTKKSKASKSKRVAQASGEPIMAKSIVSTRPGDEDASPRSKKSDRQSQHDLQDLEEPAQSVEPSEAAEDDWPSAKKSKGKLSRKDSKRKSKSKATGESPDVPDETRLIDDTAAISPKDDVVSSSTPAIVAEEEAQSQKKKDKKSKEKKGGIFSLFSRSKGTISDPTEVAENVEADSDDFDETRQRGKKSKARQSTEYRPETLDDEDHQDVEQVEDASESPKGRAVNIDLGQKRKPRKTGASPREKEDEGVALPSNIDGEELSTIRKSENRASSALDPRAIAATARQLSATEERALRDPQSSSSKSLSITPVEDPSNALSRLEGRDSEGPQQFSTRSPETPRGSINILTGSPTAIPLNLKFRRSSSVAGPTRSTSISAITTPPGASPASPTRPRHTKAVSTELRKSNEYRPLRLLERHASKQEIEQLEEPAPSLSSTQATQRRTSAHEAVDVASDRRAERPLFSESIFAPTRNDRDGRDAEDNVLDNDLELDLLDTTPSTSHAGLLVQLDDIPRAPRNPRQVPSLDSGRSRHADLFHTVDDLLAEHQMISPTSKSFPPIENFPTLPPSRPSSPLSELAGSDKVVSGSLNPAIHAQNDDVSEDDKVSIFGSNSKKEKKLEKKKARLASQTDDDPANVRQHPLLGLDERTSGTGDKSLQEPAESQKTAIPKEEWEPSTVTSKKSKRDEKGNKDKKGKKSRRGAKDEDTLPEYTSSTSRAQPATEEAMIATEDPAEKFPSPTSTSESITPIITPGETPLLSRDFSIVPDREPKKEKKEKKEEKEEKEKKGKKSKRDPTAYNITDDDEQAPASTVIPHASEPITVSPDLPDLGSEPVERGVDSVDVSARTEKEAVEDENSALATESPREGEKVSDEFPPPKDLDQSSLPNAHVAVSAVSKPDEAPGASSHTAVDIQTKPSANDKSLIKTEGIVAEEIVEAPEEGWVGFVMKKSKKDRKDKKGSKGKGAALKDKIEPEIASSSIIDPITTGSILPVGRSKIDTKPNTPIGSSKLVSGPTPAGVDSAMLDQSISPVFDLDTAHDDIKEFSPPPHARDFNIKMSRKDEKRLAKARKLTATKTVDAPVASASEAATKLVRTIEEDESQVEAPRATSAAAGDLIGMTGGEFAQTQRAAPSVHEASRMMPGDVPPQVQFADLDRLAESAAGIDQSQPTSLTGQDEVAPVQSFDTKQERESTTVSGDSPILWDPLDLPASDNSIESLWDTTRQSAGILIEPQDKVQRKTSRREKLDRKPRQMEELPEAEAESEEAPQLRQRPPPFDRDLVTMEPAVGEYPMEQVPSPQKVPLTLPTLQSRQENPIEGTWIATSQVLPASELDEPIRRRSKKEKKKEKRSKEMVESQDKPPTGEEVSAMLEDNDAGQDSREAPFDDVPVPPSGEHEPRQDYFENIPTSRGIESPDKSSPHMTDAVAGDGSISGPAHDKADIDRPRDTITDPSAAPTPAMPSPSRDISFDPSEEHLHGRSPSGSLHRSKRATHRPRSIYSPEDAQNIGHHTPVKSLPAWGLDEETMKPLLAAEPPHLTDPGFDGRHGAFRDSAMVIDIPSASGTLSEQPKEPYGYPSDHLAGASEPMADIAEEPQIHDSARDNATMGREVPETSQWQLEENPWPPSEEAHNHLRAASSSLSQPRLGNEALPSPPQSPTITPTELPGSADFSHHNQQQQLPLSSTGVDLSTQDRAIGRVVGMADVFEGTGTHTGSPRSPTRPPSMRHRQSMQIMNLEGRLEQLAADNRRLEETKMELEKAHYDAVYCQSREATAANEALEERDQQLMVHQSEIEQLKDLCSRLQNEMGRLREMNDGLAAAGAGLTSRHQEEYGLLQAAHDDKHQRWEESSRELESVRSAHRDLSSGMASHVRQEVLSAKATLADSDAEVARLRTELESASKQIRSLQRQILEDKQRSESFLTVRDEDYFEGACQQLCQHVQQWVLRFSKFSDMRGCRLADEINGDKIFERLDNSILDGSDVDHYLADRVKRRDVFMSIVMTIIWELIFTRYLFGMDREQRLKLKALEKILAEAGPPNAVHNWRATTLTLLSRRPAFSSQLDSDGDAVCTEILVTLTALLPPPPSLVPQILDSLRKVVRFAGELSIEMRTQRAEYMMLPPLHPEYTADGALARQVSFNASLMNERSGRTASNEDLEAHGAVVRLVLFPLVVKRGNDEGEGDDEIVVCPAQVLIAGPEPDPTTTNKNKKSVRMSSMEDHRIAGSVDDSNSMRSAISPAPSTAGTITSHSGPTVQVDVGMGGMI